ncbi:MAG TPA: hypothetical protein VFJ82_03045, partial [Longimicrobium sp.]|nr:hypothetical protein [Longimicrobium sp.]
MRLIRLATVPVASMFAAAAPLRAQFDDVHLDRYTTLTVHRAANPEMRSAVLYTESLPSGVEATLVTGCYGRIPDVHVVYGDGRGGRLSIFRFNAARPDTFAQMGAQTRVWGDGSVRLLVNPPSGTTDVPPGAVLRVMARISAGGRLLVRRQGARDVADAWFDLAGAARGMERLACRRGPLPPRPRLEDDLAGAVHETDPAPADSAAAAAGLDALRPYLDRELLPYVLGRAVI